MAEKKLNKVCEDVAVLQNEHNTLKEYYIGLMTDVKEIKEKLLGRPSWMVLIIISALTTITSSLIIYIITAVAVKKL